MFSDSAFYVWALEGLKKKKGKQEKDTKIKDR